MSAAVATSAVPAYRLGQLLAEARLDVGCDLEDFAARSGFTVGDLADIEAGHRLLNEQLIEDITSLYSVDCGLIIPQRAELTIDLNKRTVSSSGREIHLDSLAHDHVLDRYLSLVYVMRDKQPGTEIPLRGRDISILATSLSEHEERIIEQLERSIEQDTEVVRGLVAWFKKRLWIPRCGALVGTVSIGTLVMVAGDIAPPAAGAAQPLPDPENDQSPASRLILPSTARSPATEADTTAAENDTPPGDDTTQEAVADIETVRVHDTTQEAVADIETVDAGEPVAAPNELTATTPESLGRQAEALLPFAYEDALPGWTITYSQARDGHRGLTYPYTQTIELFVQDSDTPESLAAIIAHELGHALDVAHLNDEQRMMWSTERGLGSTPWWPTAYARDFQTGAGDFAEAFAYWATGDPSSSEIAGAIDSADLALLNSLLPNSFQ